MRYGHALFSKIFGTKSMRESVIVNVDFTFSPRVYGLGDPLLLAHCRGHVADWIGLDPD